ncbi:MAG TPA: glycosyltransferase [Solirubrobacteraceae bacterium]|nr:glycosyltransferase [Solirubrobacteraceae bacterium]
MRILHVGFGFRPWIVNGLIIYSADLMAAQARAGHDVGYFFAGRQLPVIRRPLLHRFEQEGVSMFEWVNSTLVVGRHRGSPDPERDLSDPPTEAAFRRVLARFAPAVVHVHDLGGLPSSLLEIPSRQGVATVMTMHDYVSLCPTVKLFDAEQEICARLHPGPMCVVCCAGAPLDNRQELEHTLRYERTRIRLAVPHLDAALRVPVLERLSTGAMRLGAALARGTSRAPVPSPACHPQPSRPNAQPVRPNATAAAYQRRRDLNRERLEHVDALIMFSRRAAEICRHLGVSDARMRVMAMNPAHVEHLRPKRRGTPAEPVRFGVLNACSSTEKGADLVVEALHQLSLRGLDDRYRLSVRGWVSPHVRPALEAHPAVAIDGSYRIEELDQLLEDVDVGLVPSVWEEVYGFAGLEFLAKGIPVIGNARGAIPEYVRPGATGWLNRSASAAELADLMAAAIEDPAEVQRLGRGAVALRGELIRPLARQLEDLSELYDEVLSRRR